MRIEIFGLDIRIKRIKAKTIVIPCNHCGKPFLINIKNIRAYNFCNIC
jgi:hypothetical protein